MLEEKTIKAIGRMILSHSEDHVNNHIPGNNAELAKRSLASASGSLQELPSH